MHEVQKEKCGLIKEFGPRYWLRYLGPYLLTILVGAYAVYLDNPILAFLELITVILVNIFGLGHFLCTKCPYYGQACYLLGGKLAPFLFEERAGFYTLLDKVGIGIGLLATLGIPQYWLFKSPFLLILFWIILIALVVDLHFNLCPRCKNLECPSNRVTKEKIRNGFLN